MNKNEFITLIESKTKKAFVSNPFFDACIEESIMVYNNTKLDDVPNDPNTPEKLIFEAIFRTFLRTAVVLLKTLESNNNLSYKGVLMGAFLLQKEALLNELLQLDHLVLN